MATDAGAVEFAAQAFREFKDLTDGGLEAFLPLFVALVRFQDVAMQIFLY